MITHFSAIRIISLLIAILGLATIYLFQHFNYLNFFSELFNGNPKDYHPNFVFAFNRITRYVFNDLLAILMIYALFTQRKYVMMGFIVQLIGLFIVLPVYLYIKLSLEGDSEISSPLLSFVHRIVIHPIMVLLLIPAFYYQESKQKNQS